MDGRTGRSLLAEPISFQFIVVFGMSTTTMAIHSLAYNVFATIGVLLGFSTPQDWPDMFGNPFDAYTIKNFWG